MKAITPEDREEMRSLSQWATQHPVLFSLLYDLNLLPEQVEEGSREQWRMLTTILHVRILIEKNEQMNTALKSIAGLGIHSRPLSFDEIHNAIATANEAAEWTAKSITPPRDEK